MLADPIVEETRKAGTELVKQHGNDLHRFCEFLRKSERQRGSRLVRRAPRRLAALGGSERTIHPVRRRRD